jgi:phosphatidylserine synthase
MKALIPHLFTGGRLMLGTAALIAAIEGQVYVAATLVTLGAVTDGLDGFAARRLGVVSPFGALFDYFADYMCYVVAPCVVARALLGPQHGWVEDAAVALPLLTAAIRYARNGLIVADPSQLGGEVPGLGTVFFTFLIVTAVFADAPSLIPHFAVVLELFIVAFSVLMIAPVRCPKITLFPGMAPAVLLLIAIMPFVATKFLAVAMFIIGLLYPAVASFALHSPKRHARAHQVR